MLLAFIFILLGVFLLFKIAFTNKKSEVQKPSEGEVLKNKYIIEHEKKIEDDKVYEEYLEWCKFKGELAVDKNGFDEHRMKEYHMYKKLMKSGIGGL